MKHIMITTTHAPVEQPHTADTPTIRFLDAFCTLTVAWLLLVGLWSGPSLGATLAYPNGLLAVECGLTILLILLALHRRVLPVITYPFFWPSLIVLALLIMVMAERVIFQEAAVEGLSLWKYGEPIVRGLLLYLAIAGRPRMVRVAIVSLLLGMLLLAGATILQHLTGVTRWYVDMDGGWASGIQAIAGGRAQGLTSYVNLTAAMLAASLPFWIVLAVFRVSPTRWMRVGLFLGGAMTMAALWYTNSRGPMVALAMVSCLALIRLSPRWGISTVLGVGGFLLIVWPSTPWWALVGFLAALPLGVILWKRGARYWLPLAVGFAMGGGLLVVDAYVLHYPLTWRVATAGLVDNARLDIYTEALRIVREHPWWGIGDTAVGERVIALPLLHSLPRIQRNLHNQYLQWAAAEGLPVGIVFTVLVLWSVAWCWRNAPAWPTPLSQALGWATTIGLATFLVANLADAHFWRIEGGGFFWSLFAVTAALSQPPRSPSPDAPLFSKVQGKLLIWWNKQSNRMDM